jgi:hypothetical protein
MKYRKKPVVIEAVRWNGTNVDEMLGFMPVQASLRRKDYPSPRANGGVLKGGALIIETLEGDLTASPGDWIIKGVQGEFYPCKPDIFEATYEAVV